MKVNSTVRSTRSNNRELVQRPTKIFLYATRVSAANRRVVDQNKPYTSSISFKMQENIYIFIT